MQPFHGDIEFKSIIVDGIKVLVEKDQIQQHTIHSLGSYRLPQHFIDTKWSDSDKEFLELLGWPKWFWIIVESILGFYPEEKFGSWLVQLFESIPVSSDLLFLKRKLFVAIIDHPEFGVMKACEKHKAALELLNDTRKCLEEHFQQGDFSFHFSNFYGKKYSPELGRILKGNPSFKVKSALFAIENFFVGHYGYGILCVASAYAGQLSYVGFLRHKFACGYSGLRYAFYSPLGGLGGLALKEKQNRQIKLMGDFIIENLKAKSEESTATKESPLELEKDETFLELKSLLHEEMSADSSTDNQRDLEANNPAIDISSFITQKSGRLRNHLFKKSIYYLCRTISIFLIVPAYFLIFDRSSIVQEFEVLQFSNSFQDPLKWSLLLIGLFIVLMSRNLMVLARIFKGGDAKYLIKKSDKLILYLRSFRDDNLIAKRGSDRGFIYSLFFPRLTIEEELLNALEKIGDVVVVGEPGKKIVKGGARIYAEKNDWEELVQVLMQKSQFVIFNIGNGQGLRKEMRWAKEILEPRKVLLHVPSAKWGDYPSFSSFTADVVDSIFGTSLSGGKIKHFPFFWFQPGWQLRPLPSLTYKLIPFTGSREKQYYSALHPVKDHFKNRK